MSKVKYWDSPNDANYKNRHAEVNGVEFFAFPHQSYYAKRGHRSAGVSDDLLIASEPKFSVTRNESLGSGKVNPVDYKRFDTQDEALVWASEWLTESESNV